MTVVGRKKLFPFSEEHKASSEAVRAWLAVIEMDEISRIEEACEWMDVPAINDDFALFQLGRGNRQVCVAARHSQNTLLILQVGTQSELKTMETKFGFQKSRRQS